MIRLWKVAIDSWYATFPRCSTRCHAHLNVTSRADTRPHNGLFGLYTCSMITNLGLFAWTDLIWSLDRLGLSSDWVGQDEPCSNKSGSSPAGEAEQRHRSAGLASWEAWAVPRQLDSCSHNILTNKLVQLSFNITTPRNNRIDMVLTLYYVRLKAYK